MTTVETKLYEALKAIAVYIEKCDPKKLHGGAEAMLALIEVMATETLREVEA